MPHRDNIAELSDFDLLARAPAASVCMVTYNHEPYVAQAIDSVLRQRCDHPFELVIGEDCSTDRTREIVKSYQQRYPQFIRVLTSERNVGPYENFMRTVRAGRGALIAFCDGDDYWQNPDKLQLQIDAMQANPRASLCHTDFDRRIGNRIQRSVHTSRPRKHLASGDDAYVSALYRWSVITSTSVYRKDIIARFAASKFNRTDWPFGDFNLILFAATQGTVLYLPISTATWRKVRGSLGNRGLKAKLRAAVAGAECREEFMREFPLPPDASRAVLSSVYHGLMKDAFINRNWELHRYAKNRLAYHGCKINEFGYLAQSFIMSLRFPHWVLHAAYAIYYRLS